MAKGLQSLDLDPKDLELLDKALLKGSCAELLGAMLRVEALHAGESWAP
jgi:hypothetical protein